MEVVMGIAIMGHHIFSAIFPLRVLNRDGRFDLSTPISVSLPGVL